jgi:hypothetical protein
MNFLYFQGTSSSAQDAPTMLVALVDLCEGLTKELGHQLETMETCLGPVIDGRVEDPSGSVIQSLKLFRFFTKVQPVLLLQFVETIVAPAVDTLADLSVKAALLARLQALFDHTCSELAADYFQRVRDIESSMMALSSDQDCNILRLFVQITKAVQRLIPGPGGPSTMFTKVQAIALLGTAGLSTTDPVALDSVASCCLSTFPLNTESADVGFRAVVRAIQNRCDSVLGTMPPDESKHTPQRMEALSTLFKLIETSEVSAGSQELLENAASSLAQSKTLSSSTASSRRSRRCTVTWLERTTPSLQHCS